MRCRWLYMAITISSLWAYGSVVNLGNTPWRFTKVVKPESNLATGLDVMCGSHRINEVNDGKNDTRWTVDANKTLEIDLLSVKHLSSVELQFSGDSVHMASLVVELSRDRLSWTTITNENESHACIPNKENDITTVNNTVGYAAVVVSSSCLLTIDDSCRYVRVHLVMLEDTNHRLLKPYLSELLIHPSSTTYPDSYYYSASTDDSQWNEVGIPHCYNEQDTYLNATTGERCWRGEAWYRKHLVLPRNERGKRVLIAFQSVNIGATVFINGHAINGNTRVSQPGPVTHVGSSLPFVVDITEWLNWDTDNLLAVKVSNARSTFFTWPQFAENEGFGQAMGGIVASVFMHFVDPVHIPLNAFSPMEKWGTYQGTVRIDEHQAIARWLTQVENGTSQTHRIELKTTIKDHRGKKVLTFAQQQVARPGATVVFDHTDSISNPTLWYPVGMKGTPYLYSVERKVYSDGRLTDVHTETMGLRTVEWDENYCYVNGEKCILRGFGNRNIYPGLGAAVPDWMQWADIRRMAQCGANVLRVGHQAPFPEAFNACDALGVMLIVNSGDNEWALKNEPALTYKREYDRDLMYAYRNRPSVIVWESNNGLAYEGEKYLPIYTRQIAEQVDFIAPRIVLNRDGFPPGWERDKNIVIGYTNRYEKQAGYPSINTEVYGTNWNGNPSWCIARDDYDNEKRFARFYVQNYLDDLSHQASGWINWMLAETYGEGYTIYLNGRRNQKSLGSCAMDGNRFPKLTYRIYEKALWVPFDERPGVALQSHWNYSGVQDVNAWSNCPEVELLLNGVSQGVVTPDPATHECEWKGISWEAGELRAIGLDYNHRPMCEEIIHSAGEPHHIEVTVEPMGSKTTGEAFELRANASDAFIVTATIVDEQGHWCPLADNLLHFEVEGDGVYKGSYNFYVTEGKPLSYHAPGDHELQAEGGLMRVAVRTTFNPGNICVRVSSPGLFSGKVCTSSIKCK
ncbi:MAG: DUF4982 domain-containing protein [Muribaculaceae bacterium]|nr:DUF4982 domain-containing protein [Muribaculaceae bacterium]